MKILDKLQQRLLDQSKHLSKDRFILRGLWDIDLLYRPNPDERVFNYHLIVSKTEFQGCCYCNTGNLSLDSTHLGKDARYIESQDPCLRISILDAAYSGLNQACLKEFFIEGASSEKAKQRAKIVVNEVLYQLSDLSKTSQQKVVNVGVVGNIIKEMKLRGIAVGATDLDYNIIGTSIHGVKIQDGSLHTLDLVEQSDLALITGMVLSTNSLEDILQVAKKGRTKIVMFAETGAWFGSEYCNTAGIDSVVSEPFPFYIFEGISRIRTYRKLN